MFAATLNYFAVLTTYNGSGSDGVAPAPRPGPSRPARRTGSIALCMAGADHACSLAGSKLTFNAKDGVSPSAIALSPTAHCRRVSNFNTTVANSANCGLVRVARRGHAGFLARAFSSGRNCNFDCMHVTVNYSSFSFDRFAYYSRGKLRRFTLPVRSAGCIVPVLGRVLTVGPTIGVVTTP